MEVRWRPASSAVYPQIITKKHYIGATFCVWRLWPFGHRVRPNGKSLHTQKVLIQSEKGSSTTSSQQDKACTIQRAKMASPVHTYTLVWTPERGNIKFGAAPIYSLQPTPKVEVPSRRNVDILQSQDCSLVLSTWLCW